MMNVCANKIIANEFVGEITNKANIDLDNLSENGKKIFFPSDNYIVIPTDKLQNYGDVNCDFIAPANGYLLGKTNKNFPLNADETIYVQISCNGTLLASNTYTVRYTGGGNTTTAFFPVTKNKIYHVWFAHRNGTSSGNLSCSLIFIYAEKEI